MMLGSVGFLPMKEAYPLGRAAALKALELDDMLAEAHTSLAAIRPTTTGIGIRPIAISSAPSS